MASIAATAFVGLVVLRQERKVLVGPSKGPKGELVTDEAAALATILLWPREVLHGAGGSEPIILRATDLPPIVFPIAILFLANVVDLVWHSVSSPPSREPRFSSRVARRDSQPVVHRHGCSPVLRHRLIMG
jgi:hypothetical protein